jgi:hypothetical protein
MNYKEYKIIEMILEFGNSNNLWQLYQEAQQYLSAIQENPNELDKNKILLFGKLAQIDKIIDKFNKEKLTNIEIIKNIKHSELDYFLNESTKTLLNNAEELFKNDPSQFINKFNSIYGLAVNFTSLYNIFNGVYNGTIIDEQVKISEDHFILYFENLADVTTLNELSKASNEWQKVINFFGRLTRENDNTCRIINVEKGCLVLAITAIPIIIKAITLASDRIHNSILKNYEVREKAMEIRKLKIEEISDVMDMLDKRTKLNLNAESTKIVDDILVEYGWKKEDGLFNEVKNAVTKGIKFLFKFINDGGKFVPKLLDKSNEDLQLENSLESGTNKILQIENKQKKLGEPFNLLSIDEEKKNLDENEEEINNDK